MPRISENRKLLMLAFFFLIIILGSLVLYDTMAAEGGSGQTPIAPDFKANDSSGRQFSLSQFSGKPVLIHITNIENPVCTECEKDLRGQLIELSKLRSINPGVPIITLNLRKNPYSKDGRSLAEKWWRVNITWLWTEDFEPYLIGGKYMDYWNVKGGFSNPTLLLVDGKGRIAIVYHVYKVGEGDIDGIISAQVLDEKLQALNQSGSSGLEGQLSSQSVSFLGMFLLGIVTSLAPCSIALLIAVFSYVMTSRRKDEYLRKTSSASKEGFLMGIAFTLGMGLVFFVIGLFVSQMGVFVRDARSFDLIAGVIMILLGVNNFKSLEEMIAPITTFVKRRIGRGDEIQAERESLPQRAVGFSIGLFRYSAFIGAFTLGVFFALGWAPCAVSMVFPVLIWLASQNITPLAGGVMLLAFGLGHGVPIIPISTFSRTIGGRIGNRYISAGQWTTRVFGLLVILVGIVYASRYFGLVLW